MKIKFFNPKTTEIKFFSPMPMLFFAKDIEDESEYFTLFATCFFWGLGFTFIKKVKPKIYIVCRQPIPYKLTRGKKYEMLDIVGKSYRVKCDDDEIQTISMTRFSIF